MIVLHPIISGSAFIAIDYSQHSFETLDITQTGFCLKIKSQIFNLEEEIGLKAIFSKLGCVVRMVVDSILPHAKSGSNDHGHDHRRDAPPFSLHDGYCIADDSFELFKSLT